LIESISLCPFSKKYNLSLDLLKIVFMYDMVVWSKTLDKKVDQKTWNKGSSKHLIEKVDKNLLISNCDQMASEFSHR
jgi:hypothetical protein